MKLIKKKRGGHLRIKYKTIEYPKTEEAYKLIDEGFNKKNMIIILAECHVEFEGRARSRLDRGDRLILIKKDGTFSVHQELNLDPVNWQSPGCKSSVKIENETIVLSSIRNKPDEELKVYLDTIYTATHYNCIDTKNLEIRGYEKHMVDLAWEKPDLLEKGFRPTRREYQTENGFIDLMGKDKDGVLFILEFKSRRAGTNAVKQLKGYVDCFDQEKEDLRAAIVAPEVTDNAQELLDEYGMEFISMNPPLDLIKHKTSTLDSFF